MEKISKKIKVVGFIMTCFMVFYHCEDYDNSLAINSIDSWFNFELNYIFTTMGSVVMAWFFTVTGFLLMRGLTFKNYLQKIKRRIFSLMIPFILWQIIIAVHNMVFYRSRYSLKDFLYENFAFIKWPFDGALWYLYIVFIFAVLSPILLIIFKKKNIGFIVLMCLISFIQSCVLIPNPTFQSIINYGYFPNILFYLPAYLLGSFYGKFYDELKDLDSLKYVLLLLFVFGITNYETFSAVVLYVMPILGIYLIPDITKCADLKIYKLTFLMYALHQTVIHHFKPHILRVLGLVIRPAFFINLLSRIAVLIIVIILSAIIYKVLKKICPALLKLLTGGRI